jgi:YtoQ family protein
MTLNVYLAGEIHSNWRAEIMEGCAGLDVSFSAPVTDHDSSDDCGVAIMGPEPSNFWHDNKGAKLNAIRTRHAIGAADIVVVRFGEKYKQWNAAFDAGQAVALGKSLIVMHQPEHQHALKEVDAAALAIVETAEQVAQILHYTLTGALPR